MEINRELREKCQELAGSLITDKFIKGLMALDTVKEPDPFIRGYTPWLLVQDCLTYEVTRKLSLARAHDIPRRVV